MHLCVWCLQSDEIPEAVVVTEPPRTAAGPHSREAHTRGLGGPPYVGVGFGNGLIAPEVDNCWHKCARGRSF